jgi:nitroreductase/NAD-dependent dihydropyrimidine dehydrogenase PreA subunit
MNPGKEGRSVMTEGKTMISIDLEKCTECLACYDVCPDYVIAHEDKSGHRGPIIKHPEQCCHCGHCVSACSAQAINHEKIPLETLEELQEIDLSSNTIKALLFSRRSIRKYKEEPVPDDLVKQLLESASHAGSGGNIQSEGFIILKNKAILRQLELLVINILWHAGLKFAHGDGLIMKILTKKFGPDLAEQYKSYHAIIKHRKANHEIEGMIFRNAPMVIIAHGLKANNLAQINCSIAMRNIEILAPTLDLGTCWGGFLISAAGKKSKRINQLLDLDKSRRVYGALMVGYPKHRSKHKLPRKARSTNWI